MKTIPTKSFGNLKPKKKTDFDIVAEKATKHFKGILPKGDDFMAEDDGVPREDGSYIPKSERLLAIYDLLTDKSFPRKGKGKSTKLKILEAIIVAAQDLRIKIRWDLK